MISDTHLSHLRQEARDRRIDVSMFTSRQNVQYLSGFHSSFYDDPPFLLVTDEQAVLILPESARDFEKPPFLGELLFYVNYDPKTDFDTLGNCARAVAGALIKVSARCSSVGIEKPMLPVMLREVLQEHFTTASLLDLSPVMREMRKIKTGEEIEAIRRSIRIADIGHAAVRKAARESQEAGRHDERRSELEIFGQARTAMEQAAGERILIKADVLSGPRTAAISGPPTTRTVQTGDLLLADLIPCVSGYWADTTSTTILGKPGREISEIHSVLKRTLEIGLDAARSGARACDVDDAMRSHVRSKGHSYPHHSGHGIGLSDFEGPVIGPDNQSPIRENMVLTLEPGIYDEKLGGIRLEDDILVTTGRAEVLSAHSKELS